MTKVLKFCNNCGKAKMVNPGVNYAKCCGGRVGLTAATKEQVAERAAARARLDDIAARILSGEI